jgi:hypothetical protein
LIDGGNEAKARNPTSLEPMMLTSAIVDQADERQIENSASKQLISSANCWRRPAPIASDAAYSQQRASNIHANLAAVAVNEHPENFVFI